ncbi:MAG: hypothetical protein KJN64_12240 [Ignavibacteria bacterium]|nr:hypothetical protein [Ignavibacteria bacterium]MBT8384027.1 hypothetical protein [Ignavibacteria bacterium]NNJ52507.1 hypothetical protein [Ignavibacteriaceae bacterium]NNL21785.1 hypothetical protein [Ignavibacteriaceae bacterium]
MIHTCYHIVSNHKNKYVRTLEDVQTRIDNLQTRGEQNIKVFQVFTVQDFEVDATRLKEVQIPLKEITYNRDLVDTAML